MKRSCMSNSRPRFVRGGHRQLTAWPGKLFLLAFWVLWHATSAHGHATLLKSEPLAGSALDQSPHSVRLYFDERIEAVFNSLRVVDESGQRVDNQQPRVTGQGDVLEVGLHPIRKGKYSVFWTVNSLDGHQVSGQFGFGLQSPPPNDSDLHRQPAAERSYFLSVSAALAKWAGLTGMVLWLGGLFFWLWIFTPAIASMPFHSLEQNSPIPNWSRRIGQAVGTGCIVMLAAQPAALVIQSMAMTGLSATNVLSPTTLRVVLTTTSYGFWWTLRVLLLVALAVLCGWWLRPIRPGIISTKVVARSQWPLAAGHAFLGSAMLLTYPLTGHARAVSGAMSIAVWSDWAHLASTVIWIGGLIPLCLGLPILNLKSASDRALARTVVARFSTIAAICVMALFASGIYATWLHVPSWTAFIATNYGRTLLVKLSLVAAILAIAAVNRWSVLPVLRDRSRADGSPRLQTLVAAESALGIAVLGVVAMLTGLAPSTAALPAKPIYLSKRNQGVNVSLVLTSNKIGRTSATITLRDSTGHPIRSARPVTVYERMLDMDLGLTTVETRLASDGSYGADLDFPMAGQWRVSVEASGASGDAFVTEFEFSPAP
jgi:copper transport protein